MVICRMVYESKKKKRSKKGKGKDNDDRNNVSRATPKKKGGKSQGKSSVPPTFLLKQKVKTITKRSKVEGMCALVSNSLSSAENDAV